MNNETLIEQLPLYLNQQLTGTLNSQIQQALQKQPELQQELSFLQSIKNSLKDEISSPAELGWQRLRRDIEAEQKRNTPNTKPNWWKGVGIAASLLLMIQAGYLVQHDSTQQGYRPLSTQTTANTVKLKFKAEVSEEVLRNLILSLHGSIVKGPSAIGIYEIQFENPSLAVQELNSSGLVDYAEAVQ
jgi:hypothetical protein